MQHQHQQQQQQQRSHQYMITATTDYSTMQKWQQTSLIITAWMLQRKQFCLIQ